MISCGYWEKCGLLYSPQESSRHPKLLTHAANPIPVSLEGDIYRIFYNGRDAQNRSSVGAVDVNIVTRQIIADHYEPFFLHGPPGSFYADGLSIGNCYLYSGVTYMLFMGWRNPANAHWMGEIGRLVLSRSLSLSMDDKEAFFGLNETDPISLSYPWVLKQSDGEFLMWYGSTVNWGGEGEEMVHLINFARSNDGADWRRFGHISPIEPGVAQAFSRPSVIMTSNQSFEMWYSYRAGNGSSYRIGYASSECGQNWKFQPLAGGIGVSASGWDSQMIEYPYVFSHNGCRYMLYNGNDYGKTGFGLAKFIKY
jgi:hypothetical protein